VAAITLTFDNLGEASELERGTWDGSTSLGEHPSAQIALPRLLDELDRLDLRATFFVEAINCELNPIAVGEIADRGHEVGVHGWRHEQWGELSPEDERELLERAGNAFATLDLDTRAFRPPGGAISPQTPTLLTQYGYRWCSPATEAVPRDATGDLRWVPFDWELVDAFHLLESFAHIREANGEGRRPLTPQETEERLVAGLRAGGPSTVILHPFLMLDDAWWGATRRILRLVAELSAQPTG
jgi:peptidoglycan/xylan/chitin deacetylase (PgdA/CDA1 family)